MNADTLDCAIDKAGRFLKKARACKKTAETHGKHVSFNGKESAAAKRSSMDLTRALADLRRR